MENGSGTLQKKTIGKQILDTHYFYLLKVSAIHKKDKMQSIETTYLWYHPPD
jgi:hypothetical protein